MRKISLLLLSILLFCTGCSEQTNSHNNNSIESGKEGIENQSQSVEKQTDILEADNNDIPELPEEEFRKVKETVESYYSSINQTLISMKQVYENVTFGMDYDGYEPGELVFFEVLVKNNEAKRYIAIGSKDNWKNCNVLNEGY